MQCGGYPRAQRRALELHDSKVRSVTRDGGALRVLLSACVHVSTGEPGVDAGTLWAQEMLLLLDDARVREEPLGGTLWIGEGTLSVDGVALSPLPIELSREGRVRLELSGAEGRLIAEGAGVRLELHGEPEFIERFEGTA